MRPIDADALEKYLNDRVANLRKEYGNYDAYADGVDEALTTVEEFTTITIDDLRPKGEWVEDSYNDIPCVCSHCGGEAHYISTFKQEFDYDWEENLVPTGYEEIRDYIRSEYCPHCGAKLGGGE